MPSYDKRKNIKEIKTKTGVFRKQTYGVKRILNMLRNAYENNQSYITLDGDKIDISKNKKHSKDKYKLFLSATECVNCHIKGSYFAKERINKDDQYHLDLYAIKKETKNGKTIKKEVKFTKDHTIPKSLGGRNELNNYKVMCDECNVKKGSKVIITNNDDSNETNFLRNIIHMCTISEGYTKELNARFNQLREGKTNKTKKLKSDLKFLNQIDSKVLDKILIDNLDVIEKYELIKSKKIQKLKFLRVQQL